MRSIRDQVQYINAVYQLTSWFGEPANDSLYPIIKSLYDAKLIDEIIEFIPDINLPGAKNELIKRNIGFDFAKKAGCNYFITMDTDEFYFKNQVEESKHLIYNSDIDQSFCSIVRYGLSPRLRIVEDFNLSPFRAIHVPFFFKVTEESYLGSNDVTPCLVDPTRRPSSFPGDLQYVFNNIYMHHMSFVRKDLYKKFRNSSIASKNMSKEEMNTLLFEKLAFNLSSYYFADVPDYFDIEKFTQ